MSDNPLYLPKGSVRAIVFLMVMITICYLSAKEVSIPETIGDIALTIISFYFGSKVGQMEKKKRE